jgi:hypothetical protein
LKTLSYPLGEGLGEGSGCVLCLSTPEYDEEHGTW